MRVLVQQVVDRTLVPLDLAPHHRPARRALRRPARGNGPRRRPSRTHGPPCPQGSRCVWGSGHPRDRRLDGRAVRAASADPDAAGDAAGAGRHRAAHAAALHALARRAPRRIDRPARRRGLVRGLRDAARRGRGRGFGGVAPALAPRRRARPGTRPGPHRGRPVAGRIEKSRRPLRTPGGGR